MRKPTNPPTPVSVFRGFHLMGSGTSEITAIRTHTGAVMLKQDNDMIVIPANAVSAFKRGVAQLEIIP